MPLIRGPGLEGVPAETEFGFVPVDRHGRVDGLDGVYAAGDATNFPVKQGGLAAQQADAVAEHVAARHGARLEPSPFRPVLRGLLFAGGAERYLRAPERGEAAAAVRPLWWPPTKIAGRYLAPYLYEREPASRAGTGAGGLRRSRGGAGHCRRDTRGRLTGATVHVATTRVRDVDSALIDSVCSRVRERLGAGRGAASRGVRPPVLPAGAARGPRRAGPARRLRRRARALELRAPTRARHGQGARLQPGVRAARLAVARTPSSSSSATTCRSSSTRRRWSSAPTAPASTCSIHPVIRVRRDSDGELDGGARRGRPGRRGHAGGVVHPRRDRPPEPRRPSWSGSASGCSTCSRQVSAAVEDWPAMRAPRRRPDRRAARAAAVARPRRARGGRRAAGLDGRRPLHVPRLPRVRAGRRTTATVACARSRDPASGILREIAGCEARERLDADAARARARAASRIRSSSRRPTAGRPCTGPPTSTTSGSSASRPTGRSSASGASSASTPRRPTAASLARSRSCGARSTRSLRAPASRPPATPRRRWWRSSTPTRATSCSRSPRTSCSRSRWASSPSASASASGCSSAATRTTRFVSCLVFLPRDRFNTRNRERIQEILAEAFDAESVDFELRLSESVLVRLHFTVRLRPGELARVRRGRDRGADRGGDRLVDRRAARRRCSRRPARSRAPRCTAATATRSRSATATTGSPARRWPTSGGSSSCRRRAARGQPLPPAGGRPGLAALQALPPRRAG